MTRLRATLGIGFAIGSAIALGFCGAMLGAKAAMAQMPLPEARAPDGVTLFKQQCATCHTNNTTDPVRQGPSLFGVIGRHAGTAEGFHYSAGFAKADFTWDASKLDAWMTNPQAMIPGAVMAYRQSKPEIRAAIIDYLKELH